jgi:hypothetical protein
MSAPRLEGDDAERRMRELETIVRIHVARLLKAPKGGQVRLVVMVEGGQTPRIGRDSIVGCDEKPLTGAPS